MIDLDERGSFRGHVANQNDKSIFDFSNENEETGWPDEDGLWLVEDGFMSHGRDTDGLLKYLQDMGIARTTATLTLGD